MSNKHKISFEEYISYCFEYDILFLSERGKSMISYNRLFKLLIDKGMKKTELASAAGLTPNTLAKLSKNEMVSMETLIKICRYLNCSFDDIVEIVGDKQ